MLHLWQKQDLLKYQKVSKYYDQDSLLFMSLLTAAIVKNSYTMAGIFFYLSKKCPTPNLKVFQYQI